MKEVTYEEWQKNPTPRMMWVWDNFEEDKVVRKVIFFIEKEDAQYPVISITSNGYGTSEYMHCAEIVKPRTRQMTNQELARWLREKPTREYKRDTCGFVYSFHTYSEHEASKKVVSGTLIREDYGEWKEPLIEVTDD